MLDPEPNCVWVSSDINVDIHMKPGAVPKTQDELIHFSDCLNVFLAQNGAQWARYVLFDENAKPAIELDCEF